MTSCIFYFGFGWHKRHTGAFRRRANAYAEKITGRNIRRAVSCL